MKTLEELKQYYSNATKEEIIFDNYQDMLRVVELQQEKEELIKWLEEEIKNADDRSNSISNLTNISYGSRSYALKEILERLG